jgi:hypothetical protein
MRQLSRAIDSLQKVNDSIKLRSAKDFFMSYRFPDLMDSAWQAKSVNIKKVVKFSELLPDSARYAIIERVKENAMSIKGSAESMAMVKRS